MAIENWQQLTFRVIHGFVALFITLAFVPSVSGAGAAALPQPQLHEENQYEHLGGATFRVYGYREGLVGHRTANGHIIQPNDYFAALPCFCVLSSQGGNEFQVKIEYNGKSVIVPVWDVGPWNTDDNYWDPPHMREWSNLPQGLPAAAAAYYDGYNGGLDGRGREVTSPGGIDIGDGAFYELGMTGSDWVTVTFLWMTDSRTYVDPAPPAFQPIEPFEPTETAIYFPETQHSIQNQFKSYWDANGALPVFGYPLSEEYIENNADTGEDYNVQYFERQRYEWHPEYEGTPYEVLLGRLGAELLTLQGRDWMEFAQADPEQPDYFPETGHAIAPEFTEYWHTHGLEFGDPGITFRESLALFGYPISEPMVETNSDGDTVMTQYFERAVFEYHPDEPDPYKVLLRRLAAEVLKERGWYSDRR